MTGAQKTGIVLVAMGLLGLFFKVEYSGWVLFLGLFIGTV